MMNQAHPPTATIGKTPLLPGRVRRSLRWSFLDAVFYYLMFGFGDTYLAPFAVALGARPQEIGLLTSLPQLASSLSQYKAPDIAARLGRKRTVVAAIFLHGSLWLPMLAVPWLFRRNVPLWLVAFATLYASVGALANPAWFSIMTQYVPEGKRGAYFSFRGQWGGAIALVAGFAGGVVLWLTSRWGLASFAVLFAAAFAFRMASWACLTRMYEPRLRTVREDEFSFLEFIVRARESNFVKFTFFSAAFSFAAYLSAPFFTVYMLRDLHYSYLSYVTVNTTLALFSLLAVTSWGRHADRVGNLRVIRAGGLVAALIPFLWMLSTNFPYILAVNALAGFGWAGFNLAQANFIFDSCSPGKRVRCYAYFTLVNGLGVCLGSLAGGYLIPVLPALGGSSMHTLFALSTLCRLAAWGGLLPLIREVREVVSVRQRDLILSVAGLRPLPGPSGESQTMKE